jgi:uncharacterized protein (DUF427 family)
MANDDRLRMAKQEMSPEFAALEEVNMPRAIWNDVVVAEASIDQVEVVEGNVYFPAESLKTEYFQPSGTHTTCGWKGEASYYNVVVGGQTNGDAAWYYPAPKEAAKQIAGHIAFWKGVKVEA